MAHRENKMANAKTIVTVQSVRTANAKMISAAKGGGSLPLPPALRVASAMRDVAQAGQLAMQALKKA